MFRTSLVLLNDFDVLSFDVESSRGRFLVFEHQHVKSCGNSEAALNFV